MEEPIQSAVEVSSRPRRRHKGKEKAVDQSAQKIPRDQVEDTHLLPIASTSSAPKQDVPAEDESSSLSGFPSVRAGHLPDYPEASSSKIPPAEPIPQAGRGKKRRKVRGTGGIGVEGAEGVQKKARYRQVLEAESEATGGDSVKNKAKHVKRRSRGVEGEEGLKRDKGKVVDLKRAVPSWECVPLAQNEALRIPPVWSKDGR